MSEEEISKLLDEYGIKHGPVVDSTRSLYERKLNEAMSKTKRAKTTSDKTFYREEAKIIYVYNSPVRGPETTDSDAYMRFRPHRSNHEVKTVSSLSTMSDNEIRKLLDEYRIKHGPVIGSTRSLYEKKLNEAMSELIPEKSTSDQTFYREEDFISEEEEEEEVTYVYRTPVRGEEAGDRSYIYETPSTYKNIDCKSAPMKSAQETQTPPKSSRLIPLWAQIALFLAVAIFFYVVFASMETNKSFPGLE